MCAVPMRPKEGSMFPGSGATDGCELLCGCQELHLVPLGEQPALLPEPAPQPPTSALKSLRNVGFSISHQNLLARRNGSDI